MASNPKLKPCPSKLKVFIDTPLGDLHKNIGAVKPNRNGRYVLPFWNTRRKPRKAKR